METPAAGAVVVVPFPFSDLTSSKLRPAIVLAGVGRNDWVLCQITSKAYADPLAIEITDADFEGGSLKLVSYARPGKLFTANEELIESRVGVLKRDVFEQIIGSTIKLLQSSLI